MKETQRVFRHTDRTAWPPKYLWLHAYTLAKPAAVADYKES